MQQELLQQIPEKKYFTISEVSKLCNLKQHVLRYWEKEFFQLSPVKRCGNRRYYERDEILLIRTIKKLLYEQGFTIDGARKKLNKEKHTIIKESNSTGILQDVIYRLQTALAELEEIVD